MADFNTQLRLHELASPLTVIVAYAELLKKNWGEYDDQRRQDKLEKILEYGLEAQKLCQTTGFACICDRHPLQAIYEIFDDLGLVYPSLHSETSPDIDARTSVWCDLTILKILLHHVIDNADRFRIAFSPIGARIIPGRLINHDDIGIAITNWGERRSLSSDIFQAYTSDGGGRGLGLYIVQSYVEEMGGRLSMHYDQEAKRQCTTFNIWLPREEPAKGISDDDDFGGG